MRSFLIVFLSVIFWQLGYGQILNCNKDLFSEEPFFNYVQIKKYKIKSITGEIHFKRDYEKMNNKGLFIQYNFDQKGRLINQISTYKKSEGAIDTSVVLYEYDSLNRLSVKRKVDALGFYSLNYEYDLKNNLVKETYCRDINQLPFLADFILAKQYPMAVESFSYQYLTSTQYKIKYLNNLSIPYKEVIVYLDEKGRVSERSGRFVNTGKTEKYTYQYDQNGNLIQKSEFSDLGAEKNIVNKFKYDDSGRLVEIEKFKNDKQAEHTELLYDEDPFFNARLSRDIDIKLMDVVKYKYEFY